jgi:hypothetical protein
MSAPNPYESPAAAQPARQPDCLRLANFNHTGVPYAVAFVIGPLLLAGLFWMLATGRVRQSQDSPQPIDWSGALAVAAIGIALETVAIVYAVRWPVLWIEVGPTLQYAKLLSRHEVSWSDVQRIWLERRAERPAFVERTYLVIQIDDYHDLDVFVPAERVALVAQIMQQHPRFKNSPYDEELPDVADQEDSP